METVYDWITVIAFSGLVVLFLQRSTQKELTDSIWHYLPPALGCATVNWLGNNGYGIPAALIFVVTLAYVIYVLRPSLPTR